MVVVTKICRRPPRNSISPKRLNLHYSEGPTFEGGSYRRYQNNIVRVLLERSVIDRAYLEPWYPNRLAEQSSNTFYWSGDTIVPYFILFDSSQDIYVLKP